MYYTYAEGIYTPLLRYLLLAKEYDRKNPAMGLKVSDPGAHSSTAESVAKYKNAQSDDEIQDIAPPQDPNISGMTPTEDCYTWLSGSMDGWRENDDYRKYFERSVGCDGMLVTDSGDGDYDDNGGYPIAIGHDQGIHGSAGEAPIGSEYSSSGFALGPVIRRRI